MKKVVIASLLSCFVIAGNIPMPPSIPNLSITKTNKKSDSCSLLPPMILNIPPMLEDDLDKCKNRKYLPKKELASKNLGIILGNRVEILSIEAVDGFSMLYKISIKNGQLLCNRWVTKCFVLNMELEKK